jgi:hypothetical protein
VNLMLKLNERADFAGVARKPVHFHLQIDQRSWDVGYCACAGFPSTTIEVIRNPSFEGESLRLELPIL